MMTRELVEVPTAPADAGIPAWVQTTSITVVLAVAVAALWRIVTRVLFESRDQNKQLVEAQTKGMLDLRDSVKAMDTANQLGLANVTAAVTHAVARLDRHEQKLDEHGNSLHVLDRRLTVVEGGR
jgi:hypothetical protein